MSIRFQKEIEKQFPVKRKRNNDELRWELDEQRNRLKELLELHIEPLTLNVKKLEKELSQSCEHPRDLVEVKIGGWYESDGEGNEWHGTKVEVHCKSCGYRDTRNSRDEGHHGPMFDGSVSKLLGFDLNDIWSKVQEEQQKESQKLYAKIQEENERAEYKRLKQKFEKPT